MSFKAHLATGTKLRYIKLSLQLLAKIGTSTVRIYSSNMLPDGH